MTPIDANFFVAAGAVATMLAFGLALAVHVIKYAYAQGVTNTRLKAVEDAQKDNVLTNAVLSALQSTVEALKDSVNRLDRAVENMRGREHPS